MGVREARCGEPPEEEAGAGAELNAALAKKPYQKPAFRFERVFETTALACGKINATQGLCRFNRKTS
jgi:hypothetical protein